MGELDQSFEHLGRPPLFRLGGAGPEMSLDLLFFVPCRLCKFR
jgi:hypothetical protein